MSSQRVPPEDFENLLTNLPPGSKIQVEKLDSGEVIVDGTPKTKAQLLQEKYSHLIGEPITITDAAEKYRVPRPAIRGWVYQSNYIRFVDEESYPKLVDEAEVALCAAIYHERKAAGISGVPFFDEDDTVIEELKHPDLSAYRRRKRRNQGN